MLGEIFGLNAGLTRLELTLPLFFELRPLGSSFFPEVNENAGLVGVDIASSIGLGLFDTDAPGVLSGPIFGVLRADIRGVSCSSPSRKAVSILDNEGRLGSNEASGKVRSSSMGGTSIEASNCGEGCMRMREAGVAGVAPWLFWATKAGEFLTDPGSGGGRISESMGSGEIESVSEWSWLLGTSSPLLRASCMSSLTSLGGSCIETVGFRLPGFTIGDCRTRFAGVALGAFLFVLRLLLCSAGCAIAGSPSMSMSTSIGECPVELAEVEACECRCDCACWWACALRAGDVRGLK